MASQVGLLARGQCFPLSQCVTPLRSPEMGLSNGSSNRVNSCSVATGDRPEWLDRAKVFALYGFWKNAAAPSRGPLSQTGHSTRREKDHCVAVGIKVGISLPL